MPVYDLEQVRAAAKQGSVAYRSRKVNNDVLNLGYDFDDVCKCILGLTAAEFRKTHEYEDDAPDDGYRTVFGAGGDKAHQDELYIKLRLCGDELIVDLGSFHLTG